MADFFHLVARGHSRRSPEAGFKAVRRRGRGTIPQDDLWKRLETTDIRNGAALLASGDWYEVELPFGTVRLSSRLPAGAVQDTRAVVTRLAGARTGTLVIAANSGEPKKH